MKEFWKELKPHVFWISMGNKNFVEKPIMGVLIIIFSTLLYRYFLTQVEVSLTWKMLIPILVYLFGISTSFLQRHEKYNKLLKILTTMSYSIFLMSLYYWVLYFSYLAISMIYEVTNGKFGTFAGIEVLSFIIQMLLILTMVGFLFKKKK